MRNLLSLGTMMMMGAAAFAGGIEEVALPPPQTTGGMPLMQALQARHSSREFSSRPLPAQTLSDLLWAAQGINRPDSGKRTAPSARDWREIDVYLAMADGVFVYQPSGHVLRRVSGRDLRAQTGRQDFPAVAALNLVYVADTRRMTDADEQQKSLYAAADAGFIAQNVYLYCASVGLAVVVRGSVDKEALARALGLGAHQTVVLAQTVGYPK
jgi:SagB-type dehydrogenase family enzyme